MKVIILAAGQGARLRPLTEEKPKCMVEIQGKSIIETILDRMQECGIQSRDIYIVSGYKSRVLEKFLAGRGVNFIHNSRYASTNMVCSLMCAKEIMMQEEDIIVSYGDIIYSKHILQEIIKAEEELSVVVDDGWLKYWEKRCENPLDDAESLLLDGEDNLLEIGQKTTELSRIQSQYIGLMHYRGKGITQVLKLCEEAEARSKRGKPLWHTQRDYSHMYMTDMLQGLIDEGEKVKAVHINRGWYEVDCIKDLEIASEADI